MHNSYLYQVTHVYNLVGQVSQIFLKPASDTILHYAAGQYVNIIHHDQSVSPLSIACAPNASNELEFHLFHPLQHQPAQDLLRMANQENAWSIAGPFGNCTDNSFDRNKPIIFIARGTGFAPVKAIIEAFSQSSHHQPMHLYWSMSDRRDFYLENLLAQWAASVPGFDFTLISSDKDAASPNSLCESIIRDHKQVSSCQVYAGGSLSFVQAVYWTLQPHGLRRELFYSDVF